MENSVFRTANTTQETPQEAPKVPEVTDSGNRDKAITSEADLNAQGELEDWEAKNGKYLSEYLDIKESVKEFPMKMHFSVVDNYIRSKMEENGYEKSPKNYQDILTDIEKTIGTQSLDRIKRLQRLFNYIQVSKKLDLIKKKKQEYEKKSSSIY